MGLGSEKTQEHKLYSFIERVILCYLSNQIAASNLCSSICSKSEIEKLQA